MESLKNDVDELMNDTTNPCKAIWDERMAGHLTVNELLEAVYIYTITDRECFKNYRFKPYPSEPNRLAESRIDFSMKINRIKEDEQWKAKNEFYKQCRAMYPNYFSALDIVKSINFSNLGFLKDMYEFFKERNQEYVNRLTPLIQEHEARK